MDLNQAITHLHPETKAAESEYDLFCSLFALASDTSTKVRDSVFGRISALCPEIVYPFIADLVESAERENDNSLRERWFRFLSSQQPIHSSVISSLTLELYSSPERSEYAVDILGDLGISAIGAIPPLLHLAIHTDNLDLKEKCVKSSLRISSNAGLFILRFVPELHTHIESINSVSHGILVPEMDLCGNIVFADQKSIDHNQVLEIFGIKNPDEMMIAPTVAYCLLSDDWMSLPNSTKFYILKLLPFAAPALARFSELIADRILECDLDEVRNYGILAVTRSFPKLFPRLLPIFEGLLNLADEYSLIEVTEILLLATKNCDSAEQIFMLDTLLRATNGAPPDRLKCLLLCTVNFDPNVILPSLIKMYLSADCAESEKIIGIAIQRVKGLIPENKKTYIFSSVSSELNREIPRYSGIVDSILKN